MDRIPRVGANGRGGDHRFSINYKGSFRLEVKPDISIEQVNPADYAALAIPGGFHSHGFDEAYDNRLRDLATAIHGQGGWIATFCVGVLPVAEAGLLEGKGLSLIHSVAITTI